MKNGLSSVKFMARDIACFRNGLVKAASMQRLRKLLDDLGLVRGMTIDEQDPEEFINLLLVKVFHSPPPLRFRYDSLSMGECVCILRS